MEEIVLHNHNELLFLPTSGTRYCSLLLKPSIHLKTVFTMSYTIGIIKPSHPDAEKDKDQPLHLDAFAGPGEPPYHNTRWLQLSLGDKHIRLSHPQQLALYLLLQERMDGTDKEMITLNQSS